MNVILVFRQYFDWTIQKTLKVYNTRTESNARKVSFNLLKQEFNKSFDIFNFLQILMSDKHLCFTY